ncbi:MAG: hypothetical protein NT140_12985 [Deltaproteobacteria bacterium]|nr:hypothetical protein [Deltaproteobacteria bacterium]
MRSQAVRQAHHERYYGPLVLSLSKDKSPRPQERTGRAAVGPILPMGRRQTLTPRYATGH